MLVEVMVRELKSFVIGLKEFFTFYYYRVVRVKIRCRIWFNKLLNYNVGWIYSLIRFFRCKLGYWLGKSEILRSGMVILGVFVWF